MTQAEFQAIINSPWLWICCGIMISIVIIQSVIYLKNAIKEAGKIGIERKQIHASLRASAFTAIGPSVAPVITAASMIVIVGAPNAWMNLNNIGASRTELANVAIGASAAGVDELGANIGLTAWEYALWACALNGTGWLVVTFLLVHRMERISEKIYKKYDKLWISTLMSASVTSLYAYLLSNNVIGKNYHYAVAAVTSFVCMVFLNKIFKNNHIIQEVAIGIAMLVGMFVAAGVEK